MPKVINDSPTWFPNGLRTTSLTTTEIITNSIVTGDNVINAPKNAVGEFDVRAYGAVGDGTHDDTVAIQNCINAAGANSTIIFPDTGISYRHGPLYISAQSGVKLKGSGKRATQLIFAATGHQSDTVGATSDPGTAIQFACNSGLTQQTNCSLQNLSLSGTSTMTYDKNGVRIVNNSRFTLDDVTINTMFGGPNGACALRLMGHEAIRIVNCTLSGSIPVRISLDPSYLSTSHISADGFHFTDVTLQGPTSVTTPGILGGPPINANGLWPDATIVIDDGVRVNNLLFDGIQGWIGNHDGLYWVSPTSAGDTQWSNVFKNIRKEQGYGAGRVVFRIDLNATQPLQNIIFENCTTGEDIGLIYLRNVGDVLVNGGGYIANRTSLSAGIYAIDMATNSKSLTINDFRVPAGLDTFLLAGFADSTAAVAGGRVKSTWTWPTTATWLI